MRTLFLVLLATAVVSALGAEPLKVLIFSGKNNHAWQQTTPVLQKMFEGSGRFSVEVNNAPEKLEPEALAKFDVIVSNWTNWPDVNKRVFGEKLENAFLDFVRNGKGVVMIHAASSVFYTWPEFQELVGSWWKMGQTGHGAVHEFTVKVADEEHPITKGMKEFVTKDELWHRMGTAGELKVLCTAMSEKAKGGSGLVEPVAHWRTLGKGRCFNIALGHDTGAMNNPGFQTLTLRGTEWAATGKVTIPVAENLPGPADPWKELAAYKAGGSRKALTEIANQVRDGSADAAKSAVLAAKLAEVLRSDATKDAKEFVCEQLSVIGGEACVPALAPLLTDEALNDAARFALERIKGDAAGAALREALPAAKGRALVGVLNSLGARREAKAVAAVASPAGSGDELVKAAALEALGQIGSPEAAQVLAKNRPADMKGKVGAAYEQACLRCGQVLLQDGKASEASVVFQGLLEGGTASTVRVVKLAALRGLLAAQPAEAQARAIKALSDSDPQVVAAALNFVANSKGAEATKVFAAQLASLKPAAKVMLLEALAQRGDAIAAPAVLAAADDSEVSVRVAALKALGALGAAGTEAGTEAGTTLPLLIARSSKGPDGERQAAQSSLARMTVAGVDEAIVAALKGQEPTTRVQLIGLLASRGAKTAAPAILKAASDADASVRTAALEALQAVAAPADVMGMLFVLRKLEEEKDLTTLEMSILHVGRANKERDKQAMPLVCELTGHQDPAARKAVTVQERRSILRMLSRIGGQIALKGVKSQIKHSDESVRDAALRALADWPDPEASPDLLAIVQEDENLTHHVLAMRGFLRLVTLPGAFERPKMTELLQQALTAARRDEEKTMIKAALTQAEFATNLALSGTASNLDGLAPDGGSGPPQAAIDGDPKTYWDETDDQKLYRLQVAWPRQVPVCALRIMGYGHHDFAPKDFDVVCDGKVVHEVRGAVYDNNHLLVRIPPTQCQKLELKITGYYGKSPAIRELEIFDFGKLPEVK
ncbi:MAG TPA: ThuA domain-containing protein [Planctomycetota bacterium]|jgi:type 1 glutamine amidotransferase/HEAT repeat protein